MNCANEANSRIRLSMDQTFSEIVISCLFWSVYVILSYMKSINRLRQLHGKRVLMRIDSNVPVERGRVLSKGTIRLDASVPSIVYLTKLGARVILVGHRGRPAGKPEKDLSLKAVGRYLSRAVGRSISFVEGFDDAAAAKCAKLGDGEIALLENIRFHPGEDTKDAQFSKWLAGLADMYVNDAFGVSHRDTASMVGVAELLPAYAGLLMIKELKEMRKLIDAPKLPLVVVMGGVKAATKVPVITNLLDTADAVLLGGVLANKFYAVAQGRPTEDLDPKLRKEMKHLLKHDHVRLPHDVVVYHKKRKRVEIVDLRVSREHPAQYDIMDIGPKTRAHYCDIIKFARTVVWNGPLGLFEDKRYSDGTFHIAKCFAASSATTIAGGGETLQVVKQLHIDQQISFVSTGGGAMLSILAGYKLPAIDVLG